MDDMMDYIDWDEGRDFTQQEMDALDAGAAKAAKEPTMAELRARERARRPTMAERRIKGAGAA